jgi:hypothetical protein
MGSDPESAMQFYVLETPKPDSSEDRAGRIDVMLEEGFHVGEAPRCPRCGRFLGMLTWLPPYRAQLATWGRKYGDVARTGDDLVVSMRFKAAFEKVGLKGIKMFEPVQVVAVKHRRGKPHESMAPYFKATIVRNSATVDQVASGYVWADGSKKCPECLFDTLKRNERIVIDQETWNGDDIFFPRGGHGPIVSERFRSMFHENKLLGAVFIPSESRDAGYDSCPWEGTANQR